MCVDVWAYFFGEKSESRRKLSTCTLFNLIAQRNICDIKQISFVFFWWHYVEKQNIKLFEYISDMLREGVCV